MKTEYEYFEEVHAVATDIIDRAVEQLKDQCDTVTADTVNELLWDNNYLMEAIDGHEYAIYYHHHLPILQFSDNAEYGIDNGFTDVAEAVSNGGLQSLHANLAFWAFYADVEQAIQDLISQRDFN